VPFGVDVSLGDPIWSAPSVVTLSILVGNDSLPLQQLGCPSAMMIAEKTVTMLQRGEANRRCRHFADVATIAATHEIVAANLRMLLSKP
jgi:hypothetical protein